MSWRPFGSDLVWSTVVYRSTSFSCYFSVQRIGCFKDSPRRAIPILEGKSKLLQGNYKRRKIAIRKCAMVAVNRGYNTFSVQDGGQCFSGPRAQYTFAKYGRSNRCRGGKGGPWANDVYRLTGAEPTLFIYCSFLSVLLLKQGSYGSRKTWKVLEFCFAIFQDWEVLKKDYWSWKDFKIYVIRNVLDRKEN